MAAAGARRFRGKTRLVTFMKFKVGACILSFRLSVALYLPLVGLVRPGRLTPFPPQTPFHCTQRLV